VLGVESTGAAPFVGIGLEAFEAIATPINPKQLGIVAERSACNSVFVRGGPARTRYEQSLDERQTLQKAVCRSPSGDDRAGLAKRQNLLARIHSLLTPPSDEIGENLRRQAPSYWKLPFSRNP